MGYLLPAVRVAVDLRLRERQREAVPAGEDLAWPLNLYAPTGRVVEDAALDVGAIREAEHLILPCDAVRVDVRGRAGKGRGAR